MTQTTTISGKTTTGTSLTITPEKGAYTVEAKSVKFTATYSSKELSGRATVGGKRRNIRLPLDTETLEAVKAIEAERKAEREALEYEQYGKYFAEAARTGERVLMHKEFCEDMRYRRYYAMPDGSSKTVTVNAH